MAPSLSDKQDALGQMAAATPGLVYDYRFSNGYYDGGFEENQQSQKEQAQEFQSLSFQEVQEFQWAHQSWFAQRARLHEENLDFVLRSEQWTPEDKAAILAQGRKPYVSNILLPFSRRIEAEQLGQISEWRGVGAPGQADDKAELCNHIFRWVSQTTNYPMVKSAIYRDGMIGGVGVSGTRLDPYDPQGAIQIERYRPQEFMWDIYSARTNAIEKSVNYFWRGYFLDKKTMAALFPAWEIEILQSATGVSPTQAELAHTIMRPKAAALTGRMEQGTSFDGYLNTLYGKLIFVREFYRRRPIAKWVIYNGYTKQDMIFANQQDALDKGRQLVQEAFQQSLEAGVNPQDFVPRIGMPRPKTFNVIDRLTFVGDLLIDIRTDEEDRIPYQLFIPEFVDGEITSFFQHAKDDQRLRNVSLSAIHQMMASTKGTTLINKAKYASKMTDKQIEEKSVKNGQLWIFNDPMAKDMEGFMKHIPPPNYGTLPQVIHKMVSEDINNNNGGLNSIGMTESAGESGRAIMQRRSAASMATAPSLNVFRDWDTRVGEDVLFLAQFLDPTIVMTVSNEMEESVSRAIIDDGIDSIKGLKFQITVKEVMASPTERDARLERALALAGQSPDVAADIMPIVLKYADLDATDRKQYEEARDAREQSIAQAAQFDQQMQVKDLEDKMMERKIGHLVKLKIAQSEAENKAKIVASLKLPATPAIIAEVINSAMPDSDAHPIGIAADVALGDVMELNRLGSQKAQENKLTPEWEKRPSSAGSGQSSAKSTAARSNKKVSKK